MASPARSTTTRIHPIIPDSDLLPTDSSYPLVDINLAFGKIDLVYSFDFKLDVDVLKLALGLAAGKIRSVCGRYKATLDEEGRFEHKIVFADRPILFTHTTHTSIDPATPSVPSSAVVQPASVLAPFLDPLPKPSPQLTPKGYNIQEDGDLFRVRYTDICEEDGDEQRVVGKSVLGVAWGHIIGDADLACQFMCMLSTIYTHLLLLDPPSRLLPNVTSTLSLPTFTTQHITFPQPTPQTLHDKWLLQAHCLPKPRATEMYAKAFSTPSEPMTITLTENEVKAMKRRCQYGCEEARWISSQDALSAWWVELVRAVEPEKRVERVINTISYRSFHRGSTLLPFDLTHTVGNVVQMSPVPSIPSDSTPSQTASLIRSSILTLHTNLQACSDWLSNAAYNYRKAHDTGSPIYFLPDPEARMGEEVVINSNLKYGWLEGAMFGFKGGQVMYHTSFGTVRFLRVFRPNPQSLPTLNDGPGAELSFNVLPAQKALVEAWVTKERNSLQVANPVIVYGHAL